MSKSQKNFHCSSDGTGNFVDLLTNTVVLSKVDVASQLGNLVQLKLPELTLPEFLHESAHFWCFQSPVGNVLALLELRALRTAEEDAQFSIDREWDVLEDVIRYQLTTEILRPLAEGIACFTEFDVCTSESNVIPDPLAWVFYLYEGGGAEWKAKGPNLFLFELLTRMRLDSRVVARKENLLGSDYSVEGGGHLAGYLTVKVIWQFAIRSSSLALNKDLFLGFLKSYIYDDYGFVATILDPTTREHDAGNAISFYFQQRIHQLLTLDFDKALKAYEENIGQETETTRSASGVAIQHPNFAGLGNNPKLVELGKQRLDGLLDELEACGAVDDIELLRNRHSLCIGSHEGYVRVNEHDRVMLYRSKPENWEDGVMGSYSVLPGTTPRTGAATVEVRYFPIHSLLGVFIAQDQKLIGRVLSTATSESLVEKPYDREVVLATMRARIDSLGGYLEDRSVQFVYEQMWETMIPGIEESYGQLCSMINQNQDTWQKTVKTLKSEGLFGVFNQDADFIRTLAFVGNASSVGISTDEMEERLMEMDLDPGVFRETAETFQQQGITTVVQFGDRTHSVL